MTYDFDEVQALPDEDWMDYIMERSFEDAREADDYRHELDDDHPEQDDDFPEFDD